MGWFGYQHLSVQQTPVTRTVLLRTDLAGVEGKEAVIVVAEVAPGEAFQQPPRQVHEGQNTSATVPVKVLAFYSAEQGQPLTTAVPD